MSKVCALLFVALFVIADAKKYADKSLQAEWQEFEEFLAWKKSRDSQKNGQRTWDVRSITFDHDRAGGQGTFERQQQDPPPVNDAALMGRYIVNHVDWSAVATISTRRDIETFPTAGVLALSDGPVGNGSGIPYLYLTPLDFTTQDLSRDHRATMLMTLAQSDYCKNKVLDPMDPRCGRILLSGKIKAIKNDSVEHETAKEAVFGRHPWLAHMPADHHFFFAKLKILSVVVLDNFGGPKYVSVKDYLHPPTNNVTEAFLRRFFVDQKDYENDSHEAHKADPVPNFFNPVVRSV